MCAAEPHGCDFRRVSGAPFGGAAVAAARESIERTPETKGNNEIQIVHAREHNLKNINLAIPRDKFTVITGVSGSGKSTVAFDILFAEGQRRYLESLNAYARQFVEPAGRADVDAVYGIPPTVAIEQRTSRGGRKSTVATLTEIYHFMRLLFVKLGRQHCPDCGGAIDAQSVESIHAKLMARYRGKRIALLAPLVIGRKGYYTELADWASTRGYPTLRVDGVATPTEQLAAPRSIQGAQHRAARRGDRRHAGRRSRARERSRTGAEARTQHGPRARGQGPDGARDDRGREAACRDGACRGRDEAVAPQRGRRNQQARQEPCASRPSARAEQRGRRRAVLYRARLSELRTQLRAARSSALLVQLALRLVQEVLRHRRAARRLRRRANGRGGVVARGRLRSRDLRRVRGAAPAPRGDRRQAQGSEHRRACRHVRARVARVFSRLRAREPRARDRARRAARAFG